jgi:hypothetical protein
MRNPTIVFKTKNMAYLTVRAGIIVAERLTRKIFVIKKLDNREDANDRQRNINDRKS